jgi:hypothetical protein
LKHAPGLLAWEATVIQILHDQFQLSVPEVIAHNAELNCFLMKDAGRPLREILKKQFDVALLCRAIDQFTSPPLISTFFSLLVGDEDSLANNMADVYPL